MITPTGATVAQYWGAIKDRNAAFARITFTNGVVLDNDDIEQNGIQITDILNGDTDLSIGSAVMRTVAMKILVSSVVDTIAWSSEFTLEFGITIGNSVNWVTVGTFSGSKPENYPVDGVIDFAASDRMKKFDIACDGFISSVSYPITFGDLYHNLCSYVGLQYEAGDELANIMDRSLTSGFLDPFFGYSCRDILAKMAEACGCYAKITPSGKVKMVWFSDQSSYSVPADEEFDLSAMNIGSAKTWADLESYTWEELENFTWDDLTGYQGMFQIEALSVRTSKDDIGVLVPGNTSGYIYYIIDNPFLYTTNSTEVTDYITPIYNRLSALGGYLPMSVECTGNWLVESGDIITVDFKGESILLPIFSRTLVWNGSCKDTYESTGRIERDVLSTPIHEKLTQMGRVHEIRKTIDENYELIQDQFGNYYTKIETASYIALQLTDYYGKVSGITIDTNGVGITGSKYVRVSASTSSIWEYNSDGLQYKNASTTLFTIGSKFAGTAMPSTNCGVFDFDDGDTTTGKLALVAANKTQNKYDYFLLKLASTGSDLEMSLLPSGSTKAFLGSESKDFRGLYVKNIYGTYNVGELNIFTRKSIDRGITIFQTSNSSDVSICTYDFIHSPYAQNSVILYGHAVTPSSRTVKKNIKNLPNYGEVIDKLLPVSFEYKSDKSGSRKFGLIYEDTINIFPEICECAETPGGVRKAINYESLVPILLKEIQDLRKRVKELEDREV